MSGDRPLLPPPLEPGTFRAADGTIRSFQSSRLTSNDRLGDTPSERLYTVIQQFHHDFDRLRQHLFATSTRASLSAGRMASGSDRDLRPRFNRDPQPSNNPLSSSAASPDSPSLPPLRSLDQRARVPPAPFSGSASRSSRYRPAGRYLDRFRSHLGATLDDLNRNIHDTDAQLRTLMDFGMASNIPPAPATVSPPLQGHDSAEDTRRTKRRKLNPDKHTSVFKGFRYGRYGQVEPGQLTMEIVSCDGGLYSDEHSYAPENILKNDASVYCTKSNRCNIVLKHQGGTVFSLQELVIRAPGSKFSCPVREGMIFVSMDSDDLLTRTAQYQIQYQPSRVHRRGTVYFRPEEGSRYEARPLRAYSYGADDDEDDDDDDDDEENSRTAQIPPEFTTSSLPYNVTTVCSEDESEDEDPSSSSRPPRHPPRRPNRYGISALPFDSDSDDTDFSRAFGGPYFHLPEEAAARRRYRTARLRGGGAAVPPTTSGDRAGAGSSSSGPSRSDMTLEEAQEASQIATQEAVRAVGGELMTPLAHFFIEKDKNKCTVRFDPPVSGRFILLKMWSPHQDPQKNIDIQAVVARGFAGPRYSPAIDLA
ncbi:hypothetical protein VTH82DRAFT_1142 [Thermothelomyces myriococcoides]